MILTTCAACAAPLSLDAPRCIRCHTRYCNQTCQHDHWRRGHKQLCKKIHRGGNAEKYHADKKYKEAVAAAVAATADDYLPATRGFTCYICDTATSEGLVHGGCNCVGPAGFAHMSCLVRTAEIKGDDVERLYGSLADVPEMDDAWDRWSECSLCGEFLRSHVRLALGWACWKTYLGRPEGDEFRMNAMNKLGDAMHYVEKHEAAIAVYEAEIAVRQRVAGPDNDQFCMIGIARRSIAVSCERLGRTEESLEMYHSVHAALLDRSRDNPSYCEGELAAALDLAEALIKQSKYPEAKKLLIPRIREAIRLVGPDATLTLELRYQYAKVLFFDDDGTTADQCKAITTLRNICKIAERWDSSDRMAQSIFGVLQLDLGFWEEAVAAGEGSPERTRAHIANTRNPLGGS